ncbi:hypothetical protein I316_06386 [Kwoniella heveanensis BCC8398]|uniref:Xylanolytic transcriptional activator regulatory domain-containing protein n=1 Tax=Kwoniella heveanensis BCC8398 TaxID=1296120 RepID=A0A1B9GLP7_9TREE|nr:hypothetical protein I316_06386 [Kwoniella heveanensis BCC8398]
MSQKGPSCPMYHQRKGQAQSVSIGTSVETQYEYLTVRRPLPQKVPTGVTSVAKASSGGKRGRAPTPDYDPPPLPLRNSSSPPVDHSNQAGPSKRVTLPPAQSSRPALGVSGNQTSASAINRPPSHDWRPSAGPVMVERVLEEEALRRFVTQAHHWINTHFKAIHHNTPFLSLPSVLETAAKVFAPTVHASDSPGHDDLALLYAILALGSLREQTFDSSTGKYRPFRSSLFPEEGVNDSPASTRSLPTFRSISTAQCLFRLAQDELEQMDQPSETAVQALFLLHTYISNTSMGRRSRDYVARAIMMAHELGLNRRIPHDLHLSKRTKYDKHVVRRRAMIYLYVYFSDVYLSALDSHPPLIKKQDYDADVFDVVYNSSTSGVDTPSGTPLNGLRAFVDLVTTIGSILERLHTGSPYPLSDSASCEAVLQLDCEMESLRDRLGSQTFDIDLGDRLALRYVRRFSRTAFCAILPCPSVLVRRFRFYSSIVIAGMLNLPWMQLRRVTTSVYLVFIALWAGEISHIDAEQAVNSALEVLCVIGTRWRSAAHVGQIVVQLADKTGLSYKKPILEDTASLAEQGIDVLAQLANVASDQADPLNWTQSIPTFDGVPSMDSTANTLAQLLDMDTIRRFNAELAGMGANTSVDADLLESWQTLHQPPW